MSLVGGVSLKMVAAVNRSATNAGSARWPILSAWIGETMLPDEIRIPLHSLQADIDYLFGRVAVDGSCAGAMAQSVRDRLSKIEDSHSSLTQDVERLRDALKTAERFIANGVEFGFIRMPDPGDSALDTLPKIRAVLTATECPSPTHERDGTGPESVVSDQLADANAPGRSSTEALREALEKIDAECHSQTGGADVHSDLLDYISNIACAALAAAQEPLGEPFQSVLHNNLWDLYAGDEGARAALSGSPTPSTSPMETEMTEAQIKHMVDRFLAWKLPKTFSPDGGISFERIAGADGPHPFTNEPSGTNLLCATEATEMVRHMLEGLPGGSPAPSTEGLRGWRDIKTVPDLTWVLVTGRHHRDIAPALVAQYHASSQWWESADDGAGIYMTPTHWMPLPPAPDAARTALAGVTAPLEVDGK